MPCELSERPNAVLVADDSVTHLNPDGPSWVDGGNANRRSLDLLKLLEPLAQYLPDSVVFTTSTHDLGSSILGDDQRLFLESKLAKGTYATEEELKPLEDRDRHKTMGINGLAVSETADVQYLTPERLSCR